MQTTFHFIHPLGTGSNISVSVPGLLHLSEKEIRDFTILFFFIRYHMRSEEIQILYYAFQNLNPNFFFDDLLNQSKIARLNALSHEYSQFRQSHRYPPSTKFLNKIKDIYSNNFRNKLDNSKTRIKIMWQFLQNEMSRIVIGEHQVQIQKFWRVLQIHPILVNWNLALMNHPLRHKLIVSDKHLAFICNRLHDFIQTIFYQPGINFEIPYCRYYKKQEWNEIPIHMETGVESPNDIENIWTKMPSGMRAHSLLLFTLRPSANRYHVLFKSDTQISDSFLNRNLFCSGRTKIIKIHGLLFTFDRDPVRGEISLHEINKVVTFSHPKLIPPNQTKITELKRLLENGFDNFADWTILKFYDRSQEPREKILLYQINQGEKVSFKEIYAWTPSQKIYASLTFLMSLKKLLFSGYWPVDIKSSNLCMNAMHTRLGTMPQLSVIDFIAAGSTYSLFKVNDSLALQMPINLYDGFVPLLKKLNHRGHIATYHSSEQQFGHTVNPIEFGYLIAQLMFEVVLLLFTLWNPAFLPSTFGTYKVPFSMAPRSETTKNLKRPFGQLLHECIYNTGLNEGFGLGVNLDHVVLPSYALRTWNQIKNQLETICWGTTECSKFYNIDTEPLIFKPLYDELFSSQKLEELEAIIANFSATRSPFQTTANIVQLNSV